LIACSVCRESVSPGTTDDGIKTHEEGRAGTNETELEVPNAD